MHRSLLLLVLCVSCSLAGRLTDHENWANRRNCGFRAASTGGKHENGTVLIRQSGNVPESHNRFISAGLISSRHIITEYLPGVPIDQSRCDAHGTYEYPSSHLNGLTTHSMRAGYTNDFSHAYTGVVRAWAIRACRHPSAHPTYVIAELSRDVSPADEITPMCISEDHLGSAQKVEYMKEGDVRRVECRQNIPGTFCFPLSHRELCEWMYGGLAVDFLRRRMNIAVGLALSFGRLRGRKCHLDWAAPGEQMQMIAMADEIPTVCYYTGVCWRAI